jgi:streptomycin 6-kinase
MTSKTTASPPVGLPGRLVLAARGEEGEAWLATVPGTVRVLTDRWSLEVGEPYEPGGQMSWVAPARGQAGEELVLKVAWAHPEADHEADGLREWDGDGAARLFASAEFETTTALLLERCVPGTPLESEPAGEQDVVIARLLRRLWREPSPDRTFRPLQEMCDAWADEFEQKALIAGGDLDPGLARAGIGLFRSLPATAERQVLLCTDLHAGNVLAAQREPWLMVDPKPYVGDPAYDLLQHLLNHDERLLTEPTDFPRRMADLAGVDPERLLLWLFARCVQESLDAPSLAEVARRLAPSS